MIQCAGPLYTYVFMCSVLSSLSSLSRPRSHLVVIIAPLILSFAAGHRHKPLGIRELSGVSRCVYGWGGRGRQRPANVLRPANVMLWSVLWTEQIVCQMYGFGLETKSLVHKIVFKKQCVSSYKSVHQDRGVGISLKTTRF